jgi:hypothetical protein
VDGHGETGRGTGLFDLSRAGRCATALTLLLTRHGGHDDLAPDRYVLASPLRTPGHAAWEAHSLTVLSAGRFEMGIGTGHDRVPQGAVELGMPYGSASERRDQVQQTVMKLRALDGKGRTPVLMADGRRRDALGVSYISVNEAFIEQFAPVVESLTGMQKGNPRPIDDLNERAVMSRPVHRTDPLCLLDRPLVCPARPTACGDRQFLQRALYLEQFSTGISYIPRPQAWIDMTDPRTVELAASIFASYTHRDMDVARGVAARLTELGHRVRIDEGELRRFSR